jgi:HK97 family phage prohead protease
MLDSFRKNPVFLACHKYQTDSGSSPVIGSFRNIDATDGNLRGQVKFAATPLGQEYKSLYADGHMRAVSVGFISHQPEHVTDKATGKKSLCHKKNELLEVSAVPVPANPEALSQMGFLQNAAKAELTAVVADALTKAIEKRDADVKEFIQQQIDELKSMIEERSFANPTPDLSGQARGAQGGAGDDEGSDAAAGNQALIYAAKNLRKACTY